MQTAIIKTSNHPHIHSSLTHRSPTMSARTPPSQTPAWGSSPWGQVASPVPCSLENVMSEELADQLQQEEQDSHMSDMLDNREEEVDLSALVIPETTETHDDFILAQMLQHEFDREHDAFLDKEEEQWNGSSKLQISFKNYRSVHPVLQVDEEEDDEEVLEVEHEDDPVPQFSKAGIARRGKTIITKHDANISGQRNANRVMEQFPPEFETGDDRKIKMRLPNHVFNKLKRHSEQETKRSNRIHERKDNSTTELAVDAKTRLIMYKLVNNGVLESVEGVVSSGKESVVFHGTGGSMTDALVPGECAIKVFKTTLSEFKNRCEYIRGDIRFMKDDYKKQNPRKIIKIWAEKELANLKKMENCGIPCPAVVVLKKHVLVMEFLGKKQKAAPKLRDARLSSEDMEIAYDQCITNMKKMHKEAGLVHADLSEFNMLWHNDMLYFIDVAQGVDVMHPRAMEFLLRDCANVVKFFRMAGVHGVQTKYELFNDITGLNLDGHGKDFLSQIEQYEKDPDNIMMQTGKDYPFEYFFEQAKKEQVNMMKHKRLGELFEDSEEEESDSEEDILEEEIQKEQEKLDPNVGVKLHEVLKLENQDEFEDISETLPDDSLQQVEDAGSAHV